MAAAIISSFCGPLWRGAPPYRKRMFQHTGPPVPPQQQHLYRQGSPVTAGVASLTGGTPSGASWVALKTHPPRQPGQSYRGTRFNRTRNKWVSTVNYQGRETDVSSHDHEEDAALAHDRKVLELYGATASVNFPYTGLVDPATMRVHRLRTAGGQELPLVMPSAGVDKMKAMATNLPSTTPGPDMYYRPPASPLSASSPAGMMGGGVLGVNRRGEGVGAGRQPMPPSRLSRAPAMEEVSPQGEWAPRSERAYTAADLAAVANAREHDASLVYEVVFPRAGPLGLNLRSYFAVPPAGARPGFPPYGCLEVLDAQSIYLQIVVEPGDLLVSINGKKLSGNNFVFEDAIGQCSRAPIPRLLRFARMKGAAAAEIECALEAVPCAVFDAVDGPPQRLVTAQLHPSAPPYFHLNPPTRQPGGGDGSCITTVFIPSVARSEDASAATSPAAVAASSPSTRMAPSSSIHVASTALRAGGLASGATYSPSSVGPVEHISTAALKPPGGDARVGVALEQVGVLDN